MSVKGKCNVALSHEEKLDGKYNKIEVLEPEPCFV